MSDRTTGPAIDRRTMLLGAAGFGAALVARTLGAQQQPTQNFAPMQQDAYRPTIRSPKPGAAPQLTDLERDALEHRLKCQCSCPLDVYTCRTTDFTCSVSPAMHRDVMRLIAGGYSGEEILAAFVETYGEVALTSPVKQGFNWAGYLAPGIAMATGAVLLTVMVKKWTTEARVGAAARAAEGAGRSTGSASAAATNDPSGLSADDLARLERAMREEP